MSEKHEDLMVIGTQDIGQMISSMMDPVLQAIGVMLKNNTDAIDRIAATQTVMSDRMEALERQIRLNTPIDTKQEKYIKDAMKARARELLSKRNLADDRKSVNAVSNSIRRSVLARYGIGSLREIPKHEYSVAMSQIGMWMDAVVIYDVVKEARVRAEGQTVADLA